MEKSERYPPYVSAFKSIAFASFVLGVCLLSICFWVLIALMDHEHSLDSPTSSRFRTIAIIVSQQPKGRSSLPNDTVSLNKGNQNRNADDAVEKFKISWYSVYPYFQGSCGIAVILGLIQVISCMTILSSSRKGASKPVRAKVWKIVHIVIAILLLLCVLVPVTIDKSKEDGGVRNHLDEMVKQIQKHEPNKGLDVEDVDNMTLLYCTLIADAVVIFVLVTLSHLLLKCLKV